MTSSFNDIAGDAAAPERLAKISTTVGRNGRVKSAGTSLAKKQVAVKHLRAALQSLGEGDAAKAVASALAALDIDERDGVAWHVAAISFEKAGDLEKAFTAYDAALKLNPDDPAITADLGSLAQRLGHLDLAEKLYAKYLIAMPGNIDVSNNLASVLRDDSRFQEAIDLLSVVIGANPEVPLLWNSLGTVVSDRGDMAGSLPFYDEAIRLDPGFYKAHYNRANVRMSLGDPEQALVDIDAALVGVREPGDVATMTVAKAFTQMMLGDLVGGFDSYEARFDPSLSEAVTFQAYGARWTPADDLSGKTVLVYGEQGLGDEILFANVLGDLIRAIGPKGRVILVTETRLVALFERSYPTLIVRAHRTVRDHGRLVRFVELDDALGAGIDLWVPVGSLFRSFRTRLDQFPSDRAFLKADPDRVAYWRAVLDEHGPALKVGFVWKSLVMKGSRLRGFSPFDHWKPVLETEGVQFVNLQYGDCAAELEIAKAAGLNLWTPPGIDLKADLDDVAALTSALDLFTGPMTATTNIAAACGTPTFVISTPDAWPRFGADQFPCYPSTRLFAADGFGDWEGVMRRLADSIAQEAVRRRSGVPSAA